MSVPRTIAIVDPPAPVDQTERLPGYDRQASELVILDRDGTLIHDVPFNGDPDRVEAIEGVANALGRLRAAGAKLAIASNQSGIALNILSEPEVESVMDRVAELVGPFGAIRWCPHDGAERCGCRKPAPGLLLDIAAELGVDPGRTVMIGDISADTDAARAAGMRGILVPTVATDPRDVAGASEVAPTLDAAVTLILGEER